MMVLFGSNRSSASVYKGTSSQAIRHHYDYLGEFYRLTLGPELVYSYGMWERGDTLESAQLRKLDYHARAANAVDVDRVLDVGCGWGSLMQRLVEKHNVGQAVGLTMSPGQAAWIRDRQWPHCEIRVENWFDHRPEGPYDAIIAIEAIEHFSGNTVRRSRRVASYREFFERSHSWLRPGGRLSLQANAWNGRGWLPSLMLPAERLDPRSASGGGRLGVKDFYDGIKNIREGMHASRKVFPEVFLPTRSELIEASQGLFHVREERSDPEDGVLTVASWMERAKANRARGAELIGRDAVSDIIREQGVALKFLSERRYTVLRIVFEKV
ncbi:class I SAM-dependent methyltransferase [Streptomyces formicae]|uniref:Class I SAM-dependent methyltransferase n=2 Tax=Streptomyces formicae TaxID=1616117 RepID=A0ABY3WNY2_9ACTN|nr:class I SAM-dependent methyltransferase [Streptomyces formicae]